MPYTKQTWQDHVTSRPHTYTETVNQDGTKTLTATGEVLQQGSEMSAERFNHMEEGIYDAHEAAAQLGEDKVDKETGKGLSSNDYTDTEKTKLAGLSNYDDTAVNNAMVRADAPDEEGFSQLYKTVNGVRTNVKPKGAAITVDDDFSDTSENAVQNKVITNTLFSESPNLSISIDTITTIKDIGIEVTVERDGNGVITAESSDTDVATVSVSGTTLTVTGGSSSGSATITVKCARSLGYTEQTVTLTVEDNLLVVPALSNCTPDIIKAVARSGQAANLWSVGDVTNYISLSGTVGCYNFSSYGCAFVLGFNHNSNIEGSNSIHFAFGVSSKYGGGLRVAFCDSKYNNTGGDAAFRMNTSNTNSGGWSSSYMRNTILPAFKNAMPSEWRNIITSCTKYSDNTGGGSDTASYVTSTTDDLFLLSEFEVQGARTYANSKEKDYQQQYTYFANGNGKVFYKYNDTSSACIWWLRSVTSSSSSTFCGVNTGGSAGSADAYYSLGLVLGFKVA